METGGIFSKRKMKVEIKQSQSESNPVQTKSWTSEPHGSKLKVWLLVNGSIGSDKRKISLSYTLYSLQLLDFRFPDRPSNICTTLCFHGFENLMRFCKAFLKYIYIWATVKQALQNTLNFTSTNKAGALWAQNHTLINNGPMCWCWYIINEWPYSRQHGVQGNTNVFILRKNPEKVWKCFVLPDSRGE